VRSHLSRTCHRGLSTRILAVWLTALAAAAAPDAWSVDVYDFCFTDANNVVDILRGKPGTTQQDVWVILKTYNVTPENIVNNPFLRRVRPLLVSAAAAESKKVSKSAGVQPAGAQSLSAAGLSTTSALTAVAAFIVKRFKQELEILGVETIEKELVRVDNLPQYNHPVTALAPLTMAFVRATQGTTAATDPNSWKSLADSFRKDLANSAANINPFIDSLYRSLAAMTPSRYFIHLGATAAVSIVHSARAPATIIDTVERESENLTEMTCVPAAGGPPLACFPASLRPYDAGVKAATIVSHMLSVGGGPTPWASPTQLRALLEKPDTGQFDGDAANVLLGLSYAKDQPLYQSVDTSLAGSAGTTLEALTANAAGLVQLWNAIEHFLPEFEAIQRDGNALPSAASTTVQDAQNLITDVGRLAGATAALIHAVNGTLPEPNQDDIDAATTTLVALTELVDDARKSNYTGIVAELILIVPYVVDPADKDMETFLTGPGQAIAAMAQAKTSADFSQALDNFALPPSWYLEEQIVDRSLTLSAYFGATASRQLLTQSVAGTGAKKSSLRAGFTAPVGFGYNFGNVNWNYPGLNLIGAWSVYVPVIDLGAVASWELGGGSGKLSSFTLANVLAPGAYVVLTFKNTPISIMLGTQYGPELTKVSTSSGNTIERAAWQIPALSFTFNIPIFTLYERAHAGAQ
jgi:hypothetical protein